jgi:DNA-binding MarR family transcriptional regulator
MTLTKTLSPTQARILSAAAQHPARLAEAPPNLPAAARNAVFQSMLKAGLLEEVPDPDGGTAMVLRITAAGLASVGGKPSPEEPAVEAATAAQEGGEGQGSTADAPDAPKAPVPPAAAQTARITLRDAAASLLVAWDAGEGRPDLPAAVEALRTALSRGKATRSPRDPSAPRLPREGTKRQAVLTLLRRPEGATVTQIMEATGWAQHTVRGFLAGLKKKGHAVEVLERIRQVGPNKQGAKGSYSVYCLAEGQG